jgi:large subunit ribosomal protein L6
MLQKIIKLPVGLKFSLIKTESSNLLVFRLPSDVRKKILIPNCLNISKDNIFLVVTFKGITKGDVQKYNAFISILFNFLRFLETPFKKQLSLKGLGFKSELLDNGNILELKLGLSHTVRVKVPSNEVKLEVNNNIINVSGFDAISVGNFVESIRRLKMPDAYKGKGFWLEGETRALKEIKKT